ncbi:protocadherin-like protein isoform X2 [Nematostella vectensis]|uniref:protocadherin-like protein isoform X2 n=1 Tax=Nematostella vectensis TaxID=45351 RepID=UPI0020775C93|nr:protocadherin-like protein isoform X2 [Nematostella vectensis]
MGKFKWKELQLVFTMRSILSVFLVLEFVSFVKGSVRKVEVFEGTEPGTVLLTLDRIPGFEYVLQDSSRDSYSLFHITPDGTLTTKATLDHEDKRGNVFNLVIVRRELSRREGGSVIIVSVIVLDRNDHAPKFPKDLYNAYVAENKPAGTFVLGLEDVYAGDLDSGVNAAYTYTIVEGNKEGLFAVDVNELGGVQFLRLRTTAAIDREKTAFFVLTVQVTDHGKPRMSSTTQVRINILDENDCAPVFDPQIYEISVNENAAIGSSVVHVKAVDADAGSNADVYYFFTHDHDFFMINSHTGVVSVTSHINFEKGNYFEIRVAAVDRGRNPHNASTLVKIRLLEVDGFPPPPRIHTSPPMFQLSEYYVKIREDLPVNSAFLHLRIQGDVEDNHARVTYELSPIALRDVFAINPKSGVITLRKPLDYETRKTYSVKVIALDNRHPTFFAETEITIEVTDVDENYFAPEFESFTVLGHLPQDADARTLIATVSATDGDSGSEGEVRYHIVGGSGAGLFALHETGGVITPYGSLNRDHKRYDLYIEARDNAKNPRTARLYALILADAKNEKRPFFFAPTQIAEVRENSEESETFVTVVRAEFKGKDSKQMRYSISAGNEEGKFTISPETGVISTTSRLDRERVDRYALEVRARVNGAPQSMSSPAQVVVMVTDMNDNRPVFANTNHTVYIRENQGNIPNLLCLITSDKDIGLNSDITYTIESGNDDGLFAIHPTLGILSVRRSLDFEKTSVHELTIRANDHGTPSLNSTAHVWIMVQDANDPPVFLQDTYEVSVEEDAEPGRTLTIINSTDEDAGKSGQFVCTIDDVDADVMDMFSFHTVRQGCALILYNHLEYSRRSQYTFKVRASDQADAVQQLSTTANVIVRVLDGNNNDPIFQQTSYWVALPEGSPIGTELLRVTAEDLDSGSNADVKYQSSNDIFAVDETTGTITLQYQASRNKKYSFTVTAFDQGKPSRSSVATVYVSVHSFSDSPPVFRKSTYEKRIPENFALKRGIVRVEALANGGGAGGELRYYLVGGDPQSQFNVDRLTGELSLKKPLDYEKVASYRLRIRAVQKTWRPNMPELPAEATVLITVTDINDNAPRFAIPREPLVTSIHQFRPAGTTVTKVTAYDQDSGSHALVKYGLENADSFPFTITPQTGVIKTTAELRHSERDFYAFVVTATDSTPPFHKVTANVNVHVTDASPPPVFTKGEYSTMVSENMAVGTSILRLRADYHGSNTLKYSLATGNHNDTFCIDVQGNVTLRRRLDREEIPKYILGVTVGEKNFTSAGPELKIQLGDVNDNPPLFAQPVYKVFVRENLPGGHVIGQFAARDPDKGANARVTYSIINFEDSRSDNLFSIHPFTGVLTALSTLDREDLSRHILTIQAKDTGVPRMSGLAQIVIIVDDVNDHAPRFSSGSFHVEIPLNTPPDSRVFQARALDPDGGHNGLVRYSIIQGNKQGYFSINHIDGSLFLDKKLTTLEPIDIKIQARDMGQPERSSTADIRIFIHVQAGPPQFLSSPFVGNVTENEPKGAFVVQISAASLDPVMYSIVSGNEAGNFRLHPGVGWLTTVRPLDNEKQSRYKIIVMAMDLKNRISKVEVIVNVLNVNDNKPKFVNIRNGIIEGNVLKDVAVGSRVMVIDAVDADRSDILSYRIEDEKARRYFSVNNEGVVTSTRVLRDLDSPYLFKVSVSDNGKPPMVAQAMARVVLLKYQPQQDQQRTSIQESAALGTRVFTLLTAKPIRNARYSIVSPLETKFRVDPYSGDVRVRSGLDYETVKTHRFTAEARNTRDNTDYANIDVIITVEDSNDNRPRFTMNKTNGLYLAYVSVNPIADTRVFTLEATDPDSDLNGIVRYRLITNPGSHFALNAVTGSITTRGRSDLFLPWYNLTVEAFDLGKPSLVTRAVVNVRTGQFPPLFSRKEYVFYVDENTPRGYTIGTVDAKSFSGSLLEYMVIEGRGHKRFVLDSVTGRLTLPEPLDFERDSNIYLITVSAKETDNSLLRPLKSEADVKIVLRDLNDNPPEFFELSYRDTLPESAPVGTTVLSVTARDLDSGVNGQFHYFVESQFFSVDPYTGWITTKRPLDFETNPTHSFLVVAQDSGNPARNGTARVIVELTNVNDNAPRFSQSLYNVFVAEDAGSDQLVATVQATDKDNDPVTYSIASGDNTTNFVINNKTGVIKLVSNRKPELIGPYYTMNISASDGLHVSQAMVIVAIQDVNNHKPVFTDCASYHPVVMEDDPPNTFVMQVHADDQDTGANGEVIYSIEKPPGALSYFAIDAKTGIVTTLQSFDREEKPVYQIRIIGRDGGLGSSRGAERLMGVCQVDIRIGDKNDHDPVFQNKQYEATIKEDFEVGRSVLHVSATDADAGSNAKLTYSIQPQNDYFAIDRATGTVTSKKSLLSEAKSEGQSSRVISFNVVANDNGNVSRKTETLVRITVLDLGNDPPVFSQGVYVVTVREDIAIGSSLIQLSASTKTNKLIYYSIVPGNVPSSNNPPRFQIRISKGIVWNSHRLDHKETSNFSLTIRAETTDPPMSAFANLKIFLEDVNDNPPEFVMPRYQGHVSENAPIGSSVLQVSARDRDSGENGRVTYSFVQDKDSDKFGLDENTGLVTTREVFDREAQGRYTLALKARDNGSPQKTTDTIVEIIITDENDNPPIFEEKVYNISVLESAASGMELLKVSAVDRDFGVNARVSYYISEGNINGAFEVNREFGTIRLAGTLDREKVDHYKLTLTAKDGKYSGEATVNVYVLDINDNNPKFENSHYRVNVSENRPVGTLVVKLRASDPDLGESGKFLYDISGQGLSAFTINPLTGEIRTRIKLDRELKARYDFIAFAIDSPGKLTRRTGSTDVTVIVGDVNDNKPRFPDEPYIGHVMENLKAGASVMTMSAVDIDDPDVGNNAVMTYALLFDANGLFSIDRDTGVIRTRRMLDREKRSSYDIVVAATDGGDPPQEGKVKVKVIVDDANDQHPQFTKRVFAAKISESAALGSTVATVSATDRDEGVNAKLKYSLEYEAKEERPFRIDETTGEIILALTLDYETKRNYRLKVKVRDSGVPLSFSDTASLTVEVLDANDRAPRFEPLSYSAVVREDVDIGERLLRVRAFDEDTGIYKIFKYSIAGGDPQGQFKINPDTGDLYINKSLDREKNSNHILTIRATNIAPPYWYGEASVGVQVLDVNDNGPQFKPEVYNVFVPENTPPPYVIEKLEVTDPDSDPQNGGPFKFGIRSGNEKNLFELTEDGVLKTRVTFNREETAKYELVVWAEDNAKHPEKPIKSFASVFVHVRDRNDNQHEAGYLELVLNVLEGKFGGGIIGKVFVKDIDTDDERLYELIDRDSEAFSVDRLSGAVISKPNPPSGEFSMRVKVSDRDSGFQPRVSTVKIIVKKLPLAAVGKSTAIRLRGISRETFVAGYITSFKESLAEILRTTSENVDLFSVQTAALTSQVIDVRFAAHGSPYYSPEKMIALIKAMRKNLEKAAYKLDSIGVDPCVLEPCEHSSCHAQLKVPGTVDVIGTGEQSFTSIKADLVAVCDACHAGRRIESRCSEDFCKNGGTCRESPIGPVCTCPTGLSGKHCELTTRSFRSGEWVWLPPLRQCRVSAMSLEFATKERNGLLLYGGPSSYVQADRGDVYDHLIVELQDGHVFVSVCLGDRHDVLRIGVTGGAMLNDGEWHMIEIHRDETTVRVTVDRCRASNISEGVTRSEDRSMCEVVGHMKKKKLKFLNLNDPLQLGGIASRDLLFPDLRFHDFNGCIRNLINEGRLYDLKSPSRQNNTREGCATMDQHCNPNPCHEQATCIGSLNGHVCECNMGRHGDTCKHTTQPISYGNHSHTRYILMNEFEYDPRETRIDLRVRTRDLNGGVLLHSEGTEKGEYSTLQLVPMKDQRKREILIVVYAFNTGDRGAEVRASDVNVGDGKWCSIRVSRYRNAATLTVEKDGVNYIHTRSTRGNHSLIMLDPIMTFVGGLPRGVHASVTTRRLRRRNRSTSRDNDFIGCIDDLLFHGYRLHHNGTKAFATAISKGVVEGCESNSCLASPCPTFQWCYDAWRMHVCLPRLCDSSPCLNGGTCLEGVDELGNNRFNCKCPSVYQGRTCDVRRAVVAAKPGSVLEDGLIIGLSILLVFLVVAICIVIVYIRRSKKDSYEVNMDEEDFKRDNIIDYRIDGGGEEDIDEHIARFRDYLHSLDDVRDEFIQCPLRKALLNSFPDSIKTDKYSDTGYGGSSDESPSFILLTPIKSNRKSPTLSGKSSEDEFYDCRDYHYGRAIAVSPTKMRGDYKRTSDPTDVKTKRNMNRMSDPTRITITLNPLMERRPAQSSRHDRTRVTYRVEPMPPESSSSDNDEGFASPEACSPKTSKQCIPEEPGPKAPAKRRKSPPKSKKARTRDNTDKNEPVYPHYKKADAGSFPDEVSVPPDRVPGPEYLEDQEKLPNKVPGPEYPGDQEQLLQNCAPPAIKTPEEEKTGGDFVTEEEPEKKKNKPKYDDAFEEEIFPPKEDNNSPKMVKLFPPKPQRSNCATNPSNECLETNYEFPFPPEPLSASDFIPDDNDSPRESINTPEDPTKCLPSPIDFLPEDSTDAFAYEGAGSPTISLSSLGSESEEEMTWETVDDCGDRFRKLAQIYGKPPSVTFNPNEEIIK